MRRSIKITVGIQVVIALVSMILFSVTISNNIRRIEESESARIEANALLERAQSAEVAHYKWSANLSNSLYANTEFTGSTDPTGCILGQWIYGDAATDNDEILELREELKPLHESLHESAVYVLNLHKTDPEQAQEYYQKTIQSNLGIIVGLLDDVVKKSSELSEEGAKNVDSAMRSMQIYSVIGIGITMLCLISLVIYVLKFIVKPLLMITQRTSPLLEGHLNLELNYNANNEIGDLAKTLKKSLEQTRRYVDDINRIMHELSTGNFNVAASVPFIGDFSSIEKSIDSFTSSLSSAISNINNAEHKVFGHAKNLSGSARSLADGAAAQASTMEELYTTLDNLSGSAKQNISTASELKENAGLTETQVNLSSRQLEQLITAMKEISATSQGIEKIISTIENIAFQTNILALNAAVEAVRAGTAGQGFAVVSNEIRNLAIQSDQAAKATMELIESSVQAAERGNQIVSEVSDTLQQTFELVRQSNNAISELSEAVYVEATAISQVTEGLGQISTVVQSNSNNSQESAQISTKLFEQVRLLQNQTKRFNLKNNSDN